MAAYLKRHDRKHNPFRNVVISNKSLTDAVREMTDITAENKTGHNYPAHLNLTLPYQIPEDIKEFLETGRASEEEIGPLHALLLYLAREYNQCIRTAKYNINTPVSSYSSLDVGFPNIVPTVVNFSGYPLENVDLETYRVVAPDEGEETTLENVQWYLSFYKSVYLVIKDGTLGVEEIVRLMQLGFVVFTVDEENRSLNPYLDIYNNLFPGFKLNVIKDVTQHNFHSLKNHSGYVFKAGLVEYPSVPKWEKVEDVDVKDILETSSIILSDDNFYGFDKLELINFCKEVYSSVYVYNEGRKEISLVEKIRTMSKEAEDLVGSFSKGMLPYAFRRVLVSDGDSHSFNGFIRTYTFSVLKKTEREGRLLQRYRTGKQIAATVTELLKKLNLEGDTNE